MIAEETRLGVLAGLSTLVDEMFRDLLRGHEDLCLLDFPDHPNIGDSAIYCGEVSAIRRVWGGRISYISSFSSYDRDTLRAVSNDGLLLIHGGGNIGEIYPHHHQFRERMLREWAGRRLVQLPQTLHFSSAAADDQFARAIERHGKFHLILRDQRSFEHAKAKYSCECTLAPDSAFALPDLSTTTPASIPVLALCRTDAERRGDAQTAFRTDAMIETVDWPKEKGLLDPSHLVGRIGTFSSRHGLRSAVGLANWSFDQRAWRRLKTGLALLSKGEVIATDRLHAYILALKLGRPFFVSDNSYGKLSAVYETWLGRSGLGTWTTNLSEATELALRAYRENVDFHRAVSSGKSKVAPEVP
jgi:pyruvyl transferase EpsO